MIDRWSRTAGRAMLLAGGLVVLAVLAITAGQALSHVRSLQGHLQALEAAAGGGVTDLDAASVQEVGTHLSGMRKDLAALEGLAAPLLPLCRYLGWVPVYGGDLVAAPDLLDVAVGTSAAGNRVFRALWPAVEVLSGPDGELALSLDASARAMPVLVAARPALEEAQRELSAARQARGRIETERLSPRVAGLLARLDRYLPWFETAVDGVLAAPALLGADGPRTYLVVAQNNHELRATGGFISGVGELHVEGGRITSLSFSDSYAVDNFEVPHDPAPADLHATLWGELWLFRDANWDPDFPTSARRLLDIYARDRGLQADGVITLDLTALQLLVGAVAPVEIEGIAAPVTGANVLQIIQQKWGETKDDEAWGEWWQHRKDFMGTIAVAALERVRTGEELQPAKLARAVQKALDEKHLLVYANHPDAAKLLRRQDWDGALVADSADGLAGDSLFVVDSNVGFNKADARIDRSIRYHVDLSTEGGPRARLILTYQHRGARPVGNCVQESSYGDEYADMMDRCYWDYVRVYVPAGSQLLTGPDLPLPAGSLLAQSDDGLPAPAISPTLTLGNWFVWTAFFDLPTLEGQTLTFEYQLPVEVLDHDPDGIIHYHLRIQKQPGTQATPLDLEVTLPPKAVLTDAVPAGLFTQRGPSVIATSDLRTDREFEIVFRKDEGKP